jgi:hypothetical protein
MLRTSSPIRWGLLCIVCLPGNSALVAGETYRALAPGLEYRHDARADGPLSIHAIRIDRQGNNWKIHTGLGQGTVFGLEPLDGIVARTASTLGESAYAAINGDFFLMQPGPYQGDPRGIQIIEGELVSRPNGNALWVAADGTLKIGPVLSKLRVVWPDQRTETSIGLNEARADDAVVLYTPTRAIRLGEASREPSGTRTQGGKDLILEPVEGRSWLPFTVGTTCLSRVAEIRDNGNTSLSSKRMVLSIGSKKLSDLPPLRLGDTIQLVIHTEPDLRGVKTAIGAGRILVQNGRVPAVGPANQPRHPRSMIGWNQQYLYLVVIDGRQPGVSVGMTYPELAALAREYGCTDAIELDGGGSSTLWAKGRIWNSPSDGKCRPIANGLIVFPTDQPAFTITTEKLGDAE